MGYKQAVLLGWLDFGSLHALVLGKQSLARVLGDGTPGSVGEQAAEGFPDELLQAASRRAHGFEQVQGPCRRSIHSEACPFEGTSLEARRLAATVANSRAAEVAFDEFGAVQVNGFGSEGPSNKPPMCILGPKGSFTW